MTQAKKTKPEEANSGKMRTSLYLKKETIQSLKYMAFVSRKTQTEIIDEAISNYQKQWEKENGAIPQKFIK